MNKFNIILNNLIFVWYNFRNSKRYMEDEYQNGECERPLFMMIRG